MFSFVYVPSSVFLNLSLTFVYLDKIFSIIANLRSASTDPAVLPIQIKLPVQASLFISVDRLCHKWFIT